MKERVASAAATVRSIETPARVSTVVALMLRLSELRVEKQKDGFCVLLHVLRMKFTSWIMIGRAWDAVKMMRR